MKRVALFLLYGYKKWVSPLLPRTCRYTPSCSEYSMLVFRKYSVPRASVLTFWRLCRCNPVVRGGVDLP